MHKQMDIEHLFLEDSVKQSELEEFFQSKQWRPSSSSSSQRSLSTSSPECSVQANDQYQNVKFPALKSEDIIITQAISAIFSSTSSTASNSSVLDQSLRQVQTNQSLVTGHSGFKPYNSTIPSRSEPKKKSCSQKMIKDSISYLRKIKLMRDGAVNQESQPTGHQLQHVISERKRREKLNGSFYELRLLLPPSSKVCNWIIIHPLQYQYQVPQLKLHTYIVNIFCYEFFGSRTEGQGISSLQNKGLSKNFGGSNFRARAKESNARKASFT